MGISFQVGRAVQNVIRSGAEQGIQANNQEGEVIDINDIFANQIANLPQALQGGNPFIQNIPGLAGV